MEIEEPVPYRAAYSAGSRVRIADRPFLQAFMSEWRYHHKLRPEQLEYADRETTVKGAAYYHGGDPVYTLSDIPGLWLEPCLRPGSMSGGLAHPPLPRD
jgi:hypothetical protein